MSKTVKVLVGFIVVTGAYAIATGGDAGQECEGRKIYANEVSRWIDANGGQVNYTEGKWFNSNGELIGTSGTEDSDICEK